MYYTNIDECMKTMLTGTPLTAEKVLARDGKVGSDYGGTSWYFTMHLIAKSLTRKSEEKIIFDSLHSTINNYGIHDWNVESNLRRIENKWITVYRKCGLENIHLDKDFNIIIDGNISKQEFKEFATKQYNFAMEKGLVKFNQEDGWVSRPKSAFMERIFWHYITSIYASPKLYSSQDGECYLNGIFTDLTEIMEKEEITVEKVPIWTKENTLNGLDILKSWERSLIAKNILCPITLGEDTYIAPSFFSNTDLSIFKGTESSKIVDFIEQLKKISSYPISKSNTEHYDLAKRLQRAGLIKLIDDPYKTTKSTPYAYAVPRDLFEYVEKDLAYSYSSNPLPEWGDSSITDQFFVAIGRVNIIGHSMSHESKIFPQNFKEKIDKIITDLEEKHLADISGIPEKMLDPLKTINVVKKEGNNLSVNPQNKKFIETFSDIWNNIYNDPEIRQIEFPAMETVKEKEVQQTEIQIKNAKQYFFG